jgi:hypothetical protein
LATILVRPEQSSRSFLGLMPPKDIRVLAKLLKLPSEAAEKTLWPQINAD